MRWACPGFGGGGIADGWVCGLALAAVAATAPNPAHPTARATATTRPVQPRVRSNMMVPFAGSVRPKAWQGTTLGAAIKRRTRRITVQRRMSRGRIDCLLALLRTTCGRSPKPPASRRKPCMRPSAPRATLSPRRGRQVQEQERPRTGGSLAHRRRRPRCLRPCCRQGQPRPAVRASARLRPEISQGMRRAHFGYRLNNVSATCRESRYSRTSAMRPSVTTNTPQYSLS